MKKCFVWGVALAMVFVMGSCKSQESAYKKAYEKAKQQQATEAVVETNVQQAAPVEVTPVTPTTPVQKADVSNVPVRSENVTVVTGNGLRKYSVVCGSFGVKANAERFQQTLVGKGYAAQVAFNAGNNMYRVIATTHDDKVAAVESRDALRAEFPDAWLLYVQN